MFLLAFGAAGGTMEEAVVLVFLGAATGTAGFFEGTAAAGGREEPVAAVSASDFNLVDLRGLIAGIDIPRVGRVARLVGAGISPADDVDSDEPTGVPCCIIGAGVTKTGFRDGVAASDSTDPKLRRRPARAATEGAGLGIV